MVTYEDASGSTSRRPAVPVDDSLLTQDGARSECEEMLIVDHRANVGPAQQVEHKLSTLLGGAVLPVSHARMLTQLGNRNHC